jgi:hypothetical protein
MRKFWVAGVFALLLLGPAGVALANQGGGGGGGASANGNTTHECEGDNHNPKCPSGSTSTETQTQTQTQTETQTVTVTETGTGTGTSTGTGTGGPYCDANGLGLLQKLPVPNAGPGAAADELWDAGLSSASAIPIFKNPDSTGAGASSLASGLAPLTPLNAEVACAVSLIGG